MKPVECIAEERLGEVLELPLEDERRAHVDDCPRCRALALSYRAFLGAAISEGGAYGEAERRRLDQARERVFGTAGTDRAPASAKNAPPARTIVLAPRESGWSRLFGPALRPAWAIATAVFVVGAVVLWPRPAGHVTEPVVRGMSEEPLALAEPRALSEGGVRLAWRPLPLAERYEVRFYSTALAELGHFDAGVAPTATLRPGDLPAAYRGGDLILYRIAAMRGRDDLALSQTGTLQRP